MLNSLRMQPVVRGMTRSTSRTRRLAALTCGLVLVLGAAACGGDDDDDAGGSGSGSGSATDTGDDDAAADVAVVIEGFEFDAQPVSAGATFGIENRDSAEHTFTADNDEFDEDVDAGETSSVTAPADPGTYAFHCQIHPDMTGELTVE